METSKCCHQKCATEAWFQDVSNDVCMITDYQHPVSCHLFSSSLKRVRIRLASLCCSATVLLWEVLFLTACQSRNWKLLVIFQTSSELVTALCFLALVSFHKHYVNYILKSSSCFWLYAYVVVPLWKLWSQTSITGCPLYTKFHLWIKDSFPRPSSFYHH